MTNLMAYYQVSWVSPLMTVLACLRERKREREGSKPKVTKEGGFKE